MPDGYLWFEGRYVRHAELYALEHGEEAAQRQQPKPRTPPKPAETIELFDTTPLIGRPPTVQELYRNDRFPVPADTTA